MARLRGLREFGLVVRKKTGAWMDQSTVVELSPFGIQVKQYAVTPRVEENLKILTKIMPAKFRTT